MGLSMLNVRIFLIQLKVTEGLTIGFNTREANELSIESFLKEGGNPRLHLSLKNFMDNSIDIKFWNICIYC